MGLLGDGELPRWRAATTAPTHRAYAAIFDMPYERAWVKMQEEENRPPQLRPSSELLAVVRRAYYDDVREAIERRMEPA